MGSAVCQRLGPARRPRPVPPPGLRPRRLPAPRRPFRDGHGHGAAAARCPELQRERAAPGRVPRGAAGGARLPPWPCRRRQLLRWVQGPRGPVAGGEQRPSPRHGWALAGAAEPLRLLDGESRCDGRLEVATSPGAWARVAAGPGDDRAASVACRQLGCGVPEKVYAVPAASSGPVELQELRCAGSEELLAQCNASGPAAAPGHSPPEAAVACSGECAGKGRGCPAGAPSPMLALPCRQPAAEAGGRPRALRRQGGGVQRGHVGHRVPGRLGPARCRRRVPPAGLRAGPGGARLGALRARRGDAVAGCRGLLGDGGGSLGLPSPGTAWLPPGRRCRCRVLR